MDLIFLLGTQSLFLLMCKQNLPPTWKVFSIMCLSCLVLYFSWDFFNGDGDGDLPQKCGQLYYKNIAYKPNFILSARMLLIVTSQTLNHSPIHYFCLPINLWMKSDGSLHFSIQLLPHEVQNTLTNLVSLLEIMLLGIPKCIQNIPKNKLQLLVL